MQNTGTQKRRPRTPAEKARHAAQMRRYRAQNPDAQKIWSGTYALREAERIRRAYRYTLDMAGTDADGLPNLVDSPAFREICEAATARAAEEVRRMSFEELLEGGA